MSRRKLLKLAKGAVIHQCRIPKYFRLGKVTPLAGDMGLTARVYSTIGAFKPFTIMVSRSGELVSKAS